MIADILRQQASLLSAVADLCEKGAPLKDMLDRLDRQFPRKAALCASDMADYWDVSEANARKRMEEPDFPAERCGVRITISKLALALYEIRRVEESQEPKIQTKLCMPFPAERIERMVRRG